MKHFKCTVLMMILSCGILSAAPDKHIYLGLNKAQGISQQNLIEKTAYKWKDGRVVVNRLHHFNSLADTFRVLAILAEFKQDNDEKTTGDGKFILTSSAAAIIDPPPHDAEYFQNQLLALSNYYKSVSGGKLILLGTVSTEIVTLQHEMGYYNPGTTEDAQNKGLAELFRDAIHTADSAGVSFSGYHAFIVFHAGVGKDLDLGFDTTPKDIPSVFLKLDDFRKHLASGDLSYKGIPVENGQQFIQEGILLPETENQDDFEMGLLGTSALMFGFQIGLPALWDTQSGRSGIGRWGLMDQGSGNFSGLIPAEPDAFCKVFLGWEKPVEIRNGDHLKIACSVLKESKKIYKVPISEKEYFLIENRSHDPNNDDGAYGWDVSGNRVQFTPEGNIDAEKPFGVIVRVDDYDFGLPGSGILIWHIDENIIEEKLAGNNVNSDAYHRGVDLEEADGAQDIGQSYGFLEGGSGSETGVLQDVWYADNDINILVNKRKEPVFTTDSYPNSRSNSGANSHIVIHEFSKTDTVMTFSVNNDLMHTGFPQYITQGLHLYPPLSGDLDGDGLTDLLLATREGNIYAWKQNGTKVIPNGYFNSRRTLSGDSVQYPLALFFSCGRVIDIPPTIGRDDDRAGNRETIHIALDNKVNTLIAQDKNMDGLADVLMDTLFGSQRISQLIQSAQNQWIGTDAGIVYSSKSQPLNINEPIREMGWFELNGQAHLVLAMQNGMVSYTTMQSGEKVDRRIPLEANEFFSSLAIGPIRTEGAFTVLFTSKGRCFMLNAFGEIIGTIEHGILPDSVSSPAIGDLNGDGRMEIIATAGGQIWAFNINGSLVNHFPIPHGARQITLSSPVLGDADGDGRIEIIVTTSEGLVEAYRKDASLVDGFPLQFGGKSAVTPLLLDLDGDKLIELAAVSNEGVVSVWDLPGSWDIGSAPWPSHLHDSGYTGSNMQILEEPMPGQDMMPSHLVYNYPNPNIDNHTTIRYRLEHPADVKISIFNIAGDMIKEMDGPGLPLTENEVVWNLDGVNSGIYFCKVTGKGKEEKTVIFTIAVIK